MQNMPYLHFEPVLQTIESSCEQVYLQNELPSLSCAIVYQNDLRWAKSYGYADLAGRRLADSDTIYGIGSITKVFTAIMLMQLRDAGRLQLDDPVAHFLPEIKRLPTEATITLRQLASHTGGLPAMPPLPELMQAMQEYPPKIETLRQMRFPTQDQILERLPEVTLGSRPGTRFEYSNLGVALLSYALERIAEQPYATYVRDHILLPLDMKASGFTQRDLPTAQLATSYLPFETPLLAAPPAMKELQGFAAAGALHTSTRDLARFLASLGRRDGNMPPILATDSFQEMRSPLVQFDVSHYTGKTVPSGVGIGWFLSTCDGQTIVEHGGADPSSAAYLAYVPNLELGVFAVTNVGNPPAVTRLVYESLAMVLPFCHSVSSR